MKNLIYLVLLFGLSVAYAADEDRCNQVAGSWAGVMETDTSSGNTCRHDVTGTATLFQNNASFSLVVKEGVDELGNVCTGTTYEFVGTCDDGTLRLLSRGYPAKGYVENYSLKLRHDEADLDREYHLFRVSN